MKPYNFSHAEQLIGKAVKHKESNRVYLITGVVEKYVNVTGIDYSYDQLLKELVFIDGSPCGVEEEYNLSFIEVLQTAQPGDRFLSKTLGNNLELFKDNKFLNQNGNYIFLSKEVLNDKYKKL